MDANAQETIRQARNELAQLESDTRSSVALPDGTIPLADDQAEVKRLATLVNQLDDLLDGSPHHEGINNRDRLMILRGAALMREKIAQCLETSPRKPIHECGAHVRHSIKLPKDRDVEYARDRWLDAEVMRSLEPPEGYAK